VKQTPLKRTQMARKPSTLKRSPVGHASASQKGKVLAQGARIHWATSEPVDPAHITPRSLGGCDHSDCVIGLTRSSHRDYDAGELDILPYLTLEEQGHAVSHLGILGALKRTTGDNYVPEVPNA